MWWVLLFILPVAFGSELDTFLTAHPAVPIVVHCGETYQTYIYKTGNAVDSVVVVQNGSPVFDADVYFPVVRALLYKEHLKAVSADIRILAPGTVNAFSGLLSKMRDEEYDLSVAAQYMPSCVPSLADDVRELDALRSAIVGKLKSFVGHLSAETDVLLSYLRSSDVNCSFSVDTSIYDELASILNDLDVYESKSKRLRSQIAVLSPETNCSPNIVSTLTKVLEPPYSMDDFLTLRQSLSTEKDLITYEPNTDELSALLRRSLAFYWRTLYEEELHSIVETPSGVYPLESAIRIITSGTVQWEKAEEAATVSQKYNEVLSLSSSGDYEKAYHELKDLKILVKEVLSAGPKREESFTIPSWVYAVIILVAGIVLWKLQRGGGSEEEEDYSLDAYA